MNPYDSYSQSQNFIQSQLLQSLAPAQNQPISRHVTKVNGRAGADSFNLPPNSDDILLDMNDPIIYFVQTDGAGYKTIVPYDISPHKEVNPKEQYKSLEDRISKLEEIVRSGKPNYRPNAEKSTKSGEFSSDASVRSNDKR